MRPLPSPKSSTSRSGDREDTTMEYQIEEGASSVGGDVLVREWSEGGGWFLIRHYRLEPPAVGADGQPVADVEVSKGRRFAELRGRAELAVSVAPLAERDAPIAVKWGAHTFADVLAALPRVQR